MEDRIRSLIVLVSSSFVVAEVGSNTMRQTVNLLELMVILREHVNTEVNAGLSIRAKTRLLRHQPIPLLWVSVNCLLPSMLQDLLSFCLSFFRQNV